MWKMWQTATWTDRWYMTRYISLRAYIYIYYCIKLHCSIFDYILLFAYAYVNINIYLFKLYIFISLYIDMCVCHIQRRNWICDPLNDMRQDGLAQQLEQWRLTSSPSKNIKWHRFCQQKHVPFPQPRPCHVLGLEDYLPLKKRMMSGLCMLAGWWTAPSLHEEQYEENSKAANTENCSGQGRE